MEAHTSASIFLSSLSSLLLPHSPRKIAALPGFATGRHLSTRFREIFGTSPRHIRQRSRERIWADRQTTTPSAMSAR